MPKPGTTTTVCTAKIKFKQRMVEEFEFMVTPLVFNLRLQLESDGFAIDRVSRSPEADLATGSLLFVNTLFPSKVQNEETKGGSSGSNGSIMTQMIASNSQPVTKIDWARRFPMSCLHLQPRSRSSARRGIRKGMLYPLRATHERMD